MNFLKPILVGTCSFFAVSLSAQTGSAPANQDVTVSSEATAEAQSKKQLERLTTELSLTVDQIEQIHNLNVKVASKIQAIKDNPDLEAAKKQEFIRGNREDHKRVMATILTEDQFAAYLELIKGKASDRTEEIMQIQDVEKTH